MERVALKFLELVERSIIFQGFITIMVLATTCYLIMVSKPVPDGLWNADWLVMGFFFGSKLALARNTSSGSD